MKRSMQARGKLIGASMAAMIFAGCSAGPPANLGVKDGALAPCPNSPNCVSTRSTDAKHRIEPLAFQGGTTETMTALVEVANRMERTTIVSRRERYLHVEYRTKMGFVDDVEFLLDERTRTVHFRSASRVGYSDLGVNRKRMERFRDLYTGAP